MNYFHRQNILISFFEVNSQKKNSVSRDAGVPALMPTGSDSRNIDDVATLLCSWYEIICRLAFHLIWLATYCMPP